MLPFTVEQFLGVFESYNLAVFPMQVVAYVLGLAAVFLIWRRRSDRTVAGILGLMWVWNGVAYHIMLFATINKAACGFGALFVLQGLLLIWAGGIRNSLSFKYPGNGLFAALGFIVIAYSMVVYPVLGLLFGHVYPNAPMFGIAPCPTTIFTFGLLLWSTPRLPKYLLIIPVLWAIIGFGAALNLGIKEDIGLLVSGVLAAAIILARDRKANMETKLESNKKMAIG